MVFCRLGDCFYLLFCKPVAQIRVGSDDAPRDEMVRFSILCEAEIMTGCGSKNHVRVDVIKLAEIECCIYDVTGVVALVAFVERVVQGENGGLNVLLETWDEMFHDAKIVKSIVQRWAA